MKLPFNGPYQGYDLKDVPVERLASLYRGAVKNHTDKKPIFIEIAKILGVTKDGLIPKPRQLSAEQADEWLREMSRRYHPDRGGSDEAMKIINEGWELIQKLMDGRDSK